MGTSFPYKWKKMAAEYSPGPKKKGESAKHLSLPMEKDGSGIKPGPKKKKESG